MKYILDEQEYGKKLTTDKSVLAAMDRLLFNFSPLAKTLSKEDFAIISGALRTFLLELGIQRLLDADEVRDYVEQLQEERWNREQPPTAETESRPKLFGWLSRHFG